jgi:hypothetical protein
MLEKLTINSLEEELMWEILVESIKWLSVLGVVLSLLLGILLLTRPELVKQMNTVLNRWYSARKTMKPLEIMRETDDYVYHNNKLIGWVFLIGTLFALYVFLVGFPLEPFWNTPLNMGAKEQIANVLLWSMKLFFIIFLLIGIFVWVTLIVAPDRLMRTSKRFNRWISTRLMLLPLEQMHFQVDSYVLNHSKIFGVIFIIGSLLLLLALAALSTG